MLSSSRMSGREVVLLLFSEAGARELEVGEGEDDEQVMITGLGLSVSRLSW